MKCKSLFSGIKKKKYLSPAEFVLSVEKVNSYQALLQSTI